MTEYLTPAYFLPQIDKTFRVKGGRHGLVLRQVDIGAPDPSGEFRQPFTLIFSGPPGDVLPEGSYGLDVVDGPTFEVYVMPIHTPARGRQDYQAVFN